MPRSFPGRICELEDCQGWHYAKGLCETHYTRRLRRGRTHLSFPVSEHRDGERWVSIVDQPSYEVSNQGRVRNRVRRNLIKGTITRDGYHVVGLRLDGRQRWFSVHRLVAKAFIANPRKLPQVNHRDGVKVNNTVSNLEWCTASENMRHAFATGLKTPWNKRAA